MLRLLFLALACVALASGAHAQTCSTEWENPVDGDWDDGTKWTNGVPASGDDACIVANGTYTVTLPAGLPVTNLQTLTVGGTSGTQTLLMDGYMRLTDATIGARGRMEILTNASSCLFCGLEATGTVLVEGFLSKDTNNGVFLTNTGSLEVTPGGTLRATNDARLGGPNGTFTIRGTVELADGGSIYAPAEVRGGTVRVTSGQGDLFMLNSVSGILQDATLDAASDANLIISGNYAVEGTLSGSPQGGVYVFRSTFTAAASGVTFNVNGTGLRFGNPTTNNFTTILTGGPVLNTGRFVFVEGNFFASIRGTTLTNEGTLDLEGNMGLSEGAVVRNRPSSVIRMVGSRIYQNSNNSVVRLVNEGLIQYEDPEGNFTGSFPAVTLESLPGSEIRVFGDYLDLASGPNANALPPGMMLTGDGSVRTNGLPIRSTYSPGTDAEPIGTLGPTEFGTFVIAPEAITIVDVDAGGVSDRIFDQPGHATGITIGGTLRVRARPGFTPTIGDSWTIGVAGQSIISGSFGAIEVEGAPAGVSFAVDPSQNGALVLRAVAAVSVSAPLASAQEGTPLAFVLSHPASPEAFSIDVETGGTATPFTDYTISATRGTVRARPNTTQTTVQVFPRRDADVSEGDETATLRVVLGNDAGPGASPEASVTIQDGPSSSALTVDGISPARGANLGTVTPTVFGTGFGASATMRLVRGGTSFDAGLVELTGSGAGASGVFDLAGAPLGTYDVVVESEGQTARLPGAFTVIEGQRRVPIWADVSGTPTPRFGRWSTFTVTLGNDADADVHDVILLVKITAGAEFEFMEGILDLSDTPAAEQEIVLSGVDEVQVVPLWFKTLPARSSGSFRVRVRPIPPLAVGDGVGVGFELYPPDATNAFTWSGDFDDAIPSNFGLLWGAFGLYVRENPPPGIGAPEPLAGESAKRSGGTETSWTRSDPRELTNGSYEDMINNYGSGILFNRYYGSDHEPNTSTTASAYAGYALEQPLANGVRSLGYGSAGIVVSGIASAWAIRAYGLKAAQINCDRGRLPPEQCNGTRTSGGSGDPNSGAGTGSGGGKSGASNDPNDKYGPTGEGGQRYYTAADPSNYTIAFENLPAATFPAQEVIVVDTLDTAAFDLSTFSLGPIRWGASGVVTPPRGAKTFQAEVDLAPEVPATLVITAALDEATGRVEWHFVTLDPATGDLPEDGLVGFLPPNGTSPEGEGTVNFTVEVWDDLATGTRVENGAEIIFDVNEPIVTPIWSNTVDRVAPVSGVQPLAGTESNPVVLTLSGSDAGSGIESYSVFASQDGGPFRLVGVSTEDTFEFEGESGSAYGFYSIASDFVDNIEGPKTEAEATTMIAVAGEGAPTGPLALTLEAPRPNPARGLVRLRFGLPSAGEASVRVLDALGREVATLASGETAAGWHIAEWQPGVASGVYVVELRSGDEVQHRRVTVVR